MAGKKTKSYSTPHHVTKPKPETPRTPHATGLPHVHPGDCVLLRGHGQWLLHASGSEICGYRLRRCGENIEGELIWKIQVDGVVTALAESRYGVVVAARDETCATLHRIVDGCLHFVVKLHRQISSLACLGSSAYVVATAPHRLDATLIEIDLYRQAIASERPLPNANVELSSDATGTYLGVLDPAGGTFQVSNPKDPDPCPGQPRIPPPPSPSPDPMPTGGSSGNGHESCCCCPKPGTPKPPDSGNSSGSTTGSTTGTTPGSCHPGDGGVPTPGGGAVVGQGGHVGHNPPGGTGGQNPCSADLGWRARLFAAAASAYVVADARGRNFAVLSARDMRVLDMRQLGRGGAMAIADPTSPMVLLHHNASAVWEVVHTDELIGKLGAIDRNPIGLFDEGKSFTGMQTMSLITHHAPTTGTVQVLVLPVIEAGQTFDNAGYAGFAAYLERAAFSRIRDYYFENSFGLLKDIRYQIYGFNTGPAGGPLQLPKLVQDYYYPVYDPARLELKKSGLTLPYTLAFDGRESLTLRVQAATGGRPAANIALKFPALLVAKSQSFFPAQVHFAGAETVAINVKLPSGTAKTLTLKFPAKNFDINTEADVTPRLADIVTYVDGVFAAAETAAGIAPRLFTTPVARRIKQPGMDFGFLAVSVDHTASTGPRLHITKITSTGGDPLGFQNPAAGHVVLDGTAAADGMLQSYLQWVDVLAEEDAGFNYTQRYLTDAAASTSGGVLTVKLTISDQDGGPGATVALVSSNELTELFDTATAVPNNDTTIDTSDAIRDFGALINDAFTSAVLRQVAMGGDYAGARDAINNYFNQFHSIMIGQIGVATNDPADPNTVQPGEMWTVTAPKHAGLRAVEWWATGMFAPYHDIQTQKPWNFLFFETNPDFATMCHELGHALGYRDLYQAKDFRQDLQYLETWSLMDSHPQLAHHTGYHKWESNWITADRVTTVGLADPGQTLEAEALLVPVEFWNPAIVAHARAAFTAPTLPVVQLIQLDLGGDGGMVDLIEARQTGTHFSQKLPLSPAVLITNALQPWDDTRYASDEKYRRELHLLNKNKILQNPGDTFDLAQAPALPAKGIVVKVLDRKQVDGIEVFRIHVTRQNTAFLDLYFSSSDPYYKNPDLWVDWAGDNGPGGGSSDKPEDHHRYPLGQPVDQGETVHVPDKDTELHWIVARIRNRGQVEAEEVKLNFQVCIPPGGGDKSKNFQTMRFETVPVVAGGDVPLDVPSRWDVPAGFGGHVCLLVEVADYKIPRDSDGSALASADVWVVNNWAQKNVDQYVPVHNSPYEPIEFDFSVHNAGRHAEHAYLEPENLPFGMRLTVTPERQTISAGSTVLFRCKLELDDHIIDAGCRNDREFRIVAWRVEGDTAVPWGGVAYKVKPRKTSVTTLTGFWPNQSAIQLHGAVSPDPGGGIAHVRLAFRGLAAEWRAVAIQPGGTFSLSVNPPTTSSILETVALFEGSTLLGPSRSAPLTIGEPPRIN